MKLKGTVKQNREPYRAAIGSKAPPMISNIQVITENVFVPITKTIFTKCHRETDRPKRKVKLVKSSRSNDNVIGPLLKRPSNVPGNTYAGKLLRVEQNDSRWNNQEKRKKSKKSFPVAEFPSPIFALPMAASYATRKAISLNESINESSKSMKLNKSNNKTNEVTSQTNNVYKRLEAQNSDLLDVLKSNTWNTPIASSTSNNIATGYSLISYRDSALMNIGLIDEVKRMLSSNFIAGRIKSSRCSSTSDNFLETKHQQEAAVQLSSHGPFVKDTVDRSTFTLVLDNPAPKRQQETYSPQKKHSCKIKYSWQVLGKGSQTSRTLLEGIIKANDFDDESIHQCAIKYSWQIIGIATQTSKRDFAVAEGCSVAAFPFGKIQRARGNIAWKNDSPQAVTVWRNGKRFILLNNQCTQTVTHKANQTSYLEFHKKCY